MRFAGPFFRTFQFESVTVDNEDALFSGSVSPGSPWRGLQTGGTVRILIYEYITGGGLLARDARYLELLRPEGEAMVAALAADFAALDGMEVHLIRDARLAPPTARVRVHHVERIEDELPLLCTLGAAADWTVLIAPEIDGILLQRARLVEQNGGRLLSPSVELVELCMDKMRTAEHLRNAGIPVPFSVRLEASRDGLWELPSTFCYPAVVKRIDGAGSLGTQRVAHAACRLPVDLGEWMLETLMPGIPASVAVLTGPGIHVELPAFVQQLADETFCYLGGTRLIDSALQARARHLAARTVEVLPPSRGYIGIDLLVGTDASGRDDAVIEVNPRLTTSLVGLRAIARLNLAAAMLAVATGTPATLEWSDDPVTFSADGKVELVRA